MVDAFFFFSLCCRVCWRVGGLKWASKNVGFDNNSSKWIELHKNMLGPLGKSTDYMECGPIWVQAQIWCLLIREGDLARDINLTSLFRWDL